MGVVPRHAALASPTAARWSRVTKAEYLASVPRPKMPWVALLVGGQHRGQVLRVLHRVVAIAVVHEDVDPPRLRGQHAEPRDPFAQLAPVVEVAEPLDRARAGLVPRLLLPAVEPDDGERLARRGGDGRDARARALRLVDGHVDEAVPRDEVERAGAAIVRQPAGLPELERDRRVREARGKTLQVAVRLAVRHEPLRHLEEHVGELPRRPERRERRVKALPYLVDDVGGQLARVDAPLEA